MTIHRLDDFRKPFRGHRIVVCYSKVVVINDITVRLIRNVLCCTGKLNINFIVRFPRPGALKSRC